MADLATPQRDQIPRQDYVRYEQPRSWDQYHHRPLHQNYMSHEPPVARDPLVPHGAIVAEDQSDSDVSDSPSLGGRLGGRPERLKSAPKLPARAGSESVEALQAHLEEIERTENFNSEQQALLKAKRDRKDERKRRRREVEDRQIAALYEARRRNDARVEARRAREDALSNSALKELDEEEYTTRHRMKRLKRGLPMDEANENGRSFSLASSTSPISTTLPPAKRHQTGPPAQVDAMYSTHQQQRTPVNGAPPVSTPTHNVSTHPSYQFYQSNQGPYPAPYQHSYIYPAARGPSLGSPGPGPGPGPASAAVNAGSAPRSHHLSHDAASPTVNGATPPTTAAAGLPQVNSTASPSNAARPSTKEYNTRPPDARPASNASGFASVNMPPNSGFATINPRLPSQNLTLSVQSASTPAQSYDSPIMPESEKSKGGSRADGTPGTTPTVGKRTPSTTHPYSQSEAFANRHHHCERTDSLSRGIWTSHGPQGTQDAPTGPPVEMYLRCNHDNCRRIDWRTVHGLQCHIVKSHEQPKGTIGSLEKALDRYGVPVTEVEQFEAVHGLGSGGTMADPKNLKIRNKTREAQQRHSGGPGVGLISVKPEYAMPSLSASPPPPPPQTSGVRSIGFRPGMMPVGSHMFPNMIPQRSQNSIDHGDKESEPSTRDEEEEAQKPAAFVIKKWEGVGAANTPQTRPQSHTPVLSHDPDSPKHDEKMPDAPPATGVKAADEFKAHLVRPAHVDSTLTSVVPDSQTVNSEDTKPTTSDIALSSVPTTQPPSLAAALHMHPEADKVGERQEHANANFNSLLIHAQSQTQPDTQESVEITPPPTDDVKMQDASPLKAKAAGPSPAPAPEPATMSPRSTRKPPSRRASAGQAKAETEAEVDGSEDEAGKEKESSEKGTKDEEDEDSITVAPSPRVKNKEYQPGAATSRQRRNHSGRFTRKGR